MKVKQGKSVIWLFLKINLSTTTSMKRSRRELSIDIVIQRGIFQNNQTTLFSSFTFILKTEVIFYCVSTPLVVLWVGLGPRFTRHERALCFASLPLRSAVAKFDAAYILVTVGLLPPRSKRYLSGIPILYSLDFV